MKIGFHFPFSGGLIKLKERVSASRGNTFQIFARGLRGGTLHTLKQRNLRSLMDFADLKSIQPVVVHAPYIYNFANEISEDVMRALEDLEYAKLFRSPYYVVHPGYYKNQHPLLAMENVKDNLAMIIDKTQWFGEILVKNMRGAGTEIGGELRDWGELVNFHPQIKGALDLGRMYNAGVDFTSRIKTEQFMETIEDMAGWDNIKILYLNDTSYRCGSKRDEKKPPSLGEGMIGFHGYQYVLEQPVIKKKIWIVENQPDSTYYKQSLDYLLQFHRRG